MCIENINQKFTNMGTKCFIYAIVIMTIVTGCGVSQSDYDKLKSENEKLKSELDECKNGAEKIISVVEKAYKDRDYVLAKQNINLLSTKHPESTKNAEFKELLKSIEKLEFEEAERKEQKEKELIKLANVNKTGMWVIRYYVDEFGEPTKKGYITNNYTIKGTFSNTATEGSDLNVELLINSSTNVSIQLYEYAGNNPVKAYASDSYSVYIQDRNGNRLSLTAVNYSDRLRFDESSSLEVHKALMKGGTIKFRIKEVETPTTQYQFTIDEADFYDNAFRILNKR
jgi:hypothetical protein